MNPMRFHISCPDCGFPDEVQANEFDCPRCGAHFSQEDFNAELHEKAMAQYPRIAKADLSQEE